MTVRLTKPLTVWLEKSPPHKRARRKFFVTVTAAGLMLMTVLTTGYLWTIHRALNFGEQTVVIKPGDSLTAVGAQLIQRDIIAQMVILKILATHTGLGRRIRTGEYKFPPGTSLYDFLHSIADGTGQVGIKVTVLEGWTFKQMRAHLRKAKKLKQVTANMTDAQLMRAIGAPGGLHPEGRFFPDTYTYGAGESDVSVYRQAYHLMTARLAAAWNNRAPDLLLLTRDEVLILASIIEKESWVAEEQRRIAGVFYNRMRDRIRLQTDPTVIYGLGDKFDGNLTRRHLKTDTPYNTYTRHGLTPTPISLPGNRALYAATQPLKTTAYYFVAKGDGLHQFSDTLAEHNKAVNEHIRNKRTKTK